MRIHWLETKEGKDESWDDALHLDRQQSSNWVPLPRQAERPKNWFQHNCQLVSTTSCSLVKGEWAWLEKEIFFWKLSLKLLPLFVIGCISKWPLGLQSTNIRVVRMFGDQPIS